jgi:hypothetical protein
MAVTRELVEFDRLDTAGVEERMRALPDGAWVNIEPIVDEDDLADLRARMPHPLLRLFSAKGRPIPFGTVVANERDLSVGLEHSQGQRVVPILREYGITVPSSWRQQQDNAKRGVVFAAPRDEDPHVVLDWILMAATALSDVPIRGRWTAMIATP